MDNEQERVDGWCDRQEMLLGYLQNGSYHRLRMWLKERNHTDSAQTLVKHLVNPLRQRLLSPQPTLLAMRGILDGILINHIARCLSSTAKYPGDHALIMGWNVNDITRLWLEGWIASEHGWRGDASMGAAGPDYLAESRHRNVSRRRRLRRLSGLRVTGNLWPGSPAKRSASREEAAAILHHGTFPGLRRKRLTRATGYRQSVAR